MRRFVVSAVIVVIFTIAFTKEGRELVDGWFGESDPAMTESATFATGYEDALSDVPPFGSPGATVYAAAGAVDGDTLKLVRSVASADLFRAAGADDPGLRIRLFGAKAPETAKATTTAEACSGAAHARLAALIEDGVRVEADPDRKADRYGRALFYVYTPAGDSIERILVSEGLAEAWTGNGIHRNELAAIESLAREHGQGCLWSSA